MTEYSYKEMEPQEEILKALLHLPSPLEGKSMIKKVDLLLLDDEYFVKIKKNLCKLSFVTDFRREIKID